MDTYLIQRLIKKPKNDFQAKVSRVFGGGALQMTDKAWDLCQQVFDIDYMGAAEYEFGTLPKALKAFVQEREHHVSFEVVFTRKDVKVNWSKEHQHNMARRKELADAHKAGVKPKRAKKYTEPAFEPKTVYVICHKDASYQVTALLHRLARGHYTKGGNRFDTALDPCSEHDKATIGWFDVENKFFFFIDKEVFEGARTLFDTPGEHHGKA